MIFKAIRLVGKASTLLWIAKTGYDVYQTGSTAYKVYKKVKGVPGGSKVKGVVSDTVDIAKEVKRVLKKKK